MRRLMILLLTLLVLAQPGLAQDARPLVVFVEDARVLQTSSVTDNGPDGVTRLGEMFVRQGARTAFVRLTDALPEDAQVIVLVRPRGSMPAAYLARIWLQMERGAGLLLAIDPPGHVNARPEGQNSGLDRLLTLDYGVSLLNGLLIEPWFTLGTIREVQTSYLYAHGASVPHPIFDPLARYELPVRLWGARPLAVEPFGIDSQAASLLQTTPLYAETSPTTLALQEPTPLEINLEADPQGLMNVAAVGENVRSGSRIAIIGDGEFVQNGFGLSYIGDSTIPRYAGNYVLTDRIIAWLLQNEAYPDLPDGLTWVAVDGDRAEWENVAVAVNDSLDDSTVNALNLTQIKAFRNESFIYMALETAASPSPDLRVEIEIDRNRDRQPDVVLSFHSSGVLAQSGVDEPAPVLDAAMGIGDMTELRLPRRLAEGDILSVCLVSTRDLAFPQPPDCADAPVAVPSVGDRDPVNVRTPRQIIATVTGSNSVNLREAPGIDSPVLTTASFGAEFAVIGRDATAEWFRVQDARWTGWLSGLVVRVNGDVDLLPIVTR